MVQELLIGLLFVSAITFIGKKIYTDFSTKGDCPKGCGACDTDVIGENK